MKTSLSKSLATELYYKAQTGIRSPRYNENCGRVMAILNKAEKAGCPICEKVKATFDLNRRICSISLDDARTIADYVVNYKEKTYTVTFSFPNSGAIKTIAHRDAVKRAKERSKEIPYKFRGDDIVRVQIAAYYEGEEAEEEFGTSYYLLWLETYKNGKRINRRKV